MSTLTQPQEHAASTGRPFAESRLGLSPILAGRPRVRAQDLGDVRVVQPPKNRTDHRIIHNRRQVCLSSRDGTVFHLRRTRKEGARALLAQTPDLSCFAAVAILPDHSWRAGCHLRSGHTRQTDVVDVQLAHPAGLRGTAVPDPNDPLVDAT